MTHEFLKVADLEHDWLQSIDPDNMIGYKAWSLIGQFRISNTLNQYIQYLDIFIYTGNRFQVYTESSIQIMYINI